MSDQWLWYLLLIPAGLVAGVVNTIAGGGSFLTLPALMLCGLSPQVANGTNRISILVQGALGTEIYRRQSMLDGAAIKRLMPPMLLGTVGGAYLAVVMSPEAFRAAFGGLFLAMAVVMVLRAKAMLSTHVRPRGPGWLEAAVTLGLGVYAGFIQAGVGLLILILMPMVSGLDLKRANGVKLALVTTVQVVALGVFIWQDQVDWLAGITLTIGNALGAPIGARLALRKGQGLIFGFVVVVMVATGVKLLVW